MNVAIWGAGNIGAGLVNRLAISAFAEKIIWINRTLDKVDRRAVDVKHGLALTPKCRTVIPVTEERASSWLAEVDVVVLTHGMGVPSGGNRADLYRNNRDVFLGKTIPALIGFEGIVLVITNPLDLMTRLVLLEGSLPAERVLGLGTVVETTRLKSAVAGRMWSTPPSRDVDALAVGTHDERFIPLVREADFPDDLLESAHREVVKAAARVKGADSATLFPIVEGAMSVLTSIAEDDQASWTVSIVDRHTPEQFCYSLPCRVGRSGWSDRDATLIKTHGCEALLEESLAPMRDMI